MKPLLILIFVLVPSMLSIPTWDSKLHYQYLWKVLGAETILATDYSEAIWPDGTRINLLRVKQDGKYYDLIPNWSEV